MPFSARQQDVNLLSTPGQRASSASFKEARLPMELVRILFPQAEAPSGLRPRKTFAGDFDAPQL